MTSRTVGVSRSDASVEATSSAEVNESPVANRVTWWPCLTSSSVRRHAFDWGSDLRDPHRLNSPFSKCVGRVSYQLGDVPGGPRFLRTIIYGGESGLARASQKSSVGQTLLITQ